MSGPQKSAYALLSALCDCSSDRFQPVRRLLMSTGGLDAEGFIDARGLLMALDTFDITHTIGTEEEMCAIMRLIDSECDDKLDAFSLEKEAPSTCGRTGACAGRTSTIVRSARRRGSATPAAVPPSAQRRGG
ncbi:unnamed protein product [Prorocentrum cordatum]|uniref:EF-hand domain-containing protein n=1 Tax=Prorocentrum cordatum TaxID=2364126 RepID=A0ABN9T073_9DINO|nr:unnamed protein product [Polarella glacialis]